MKATQFFVGFGPTLWSRAAGRDRVRRQGDPGRRLRQDRRDDPARGGRAGRRGAGVLPAARPPQRLIVLVAGSIMHFLIAHRPACVVFVAAADLGRPPPARVNGRERAAVRHADVDAGRVHGRRPGSARARQARGRATRSSPSTAAELTDGIAQLVARRANAAGHVAGHLHRAARRQAARRDDGTPQVVRRRRHASASASTTRRASVGAGQRRRAGVRPPSATTVVGSRSRRMGAIPHELAQIVHPTTSAQRTATAAAVSVTSVVGVAPGQRRGGRRGRHLGPASATLARDRGQREPLRRHLQPAAAAAARRRPHRGPAVREGPLRASPACAGGPTRAGST